MKLIKYFIQFVVISFLLILFKMLGFKIASNLSSKIFTNIGPLFRSKNLIKQISGPAESKNTLYPKTITKLEKRFETKTKAQLQYISTSTDFSPEAHVAAKKLLDIKIEE